MRFHTHNNRREEKGVALLLALFALILISAVGVAIVFMSTGETSIVANERAASAAWEGAKGGLEEMRARISLGDPTSIGNTVPANDSRPLDSLHVVYIFNPGPGDPAFPINSPPPAPYTDTEYKTEWGVDITTLPAGNIKTYTSNMQGLLAPGGPLASIPSYKWVRLTVKTELSAQQDVDGDGCLNPNLACGPIAKPILFDFAANRQTLIGVPSPTTIVYRVTALSVLPNGGTRMVQYDIVPPPPLPPLPGGLTLCGGPGTPVNVTQWPTSNGWTVSGCDQAGPPCPPPSPTTIPAVATCNPTAQSTMSPGSWKLPTSTQGAGASPSVVNGSGSMDPCLTSYTCLQTLATSLEAIAHKDPGCGAMGTATQPAITWFSTNQVCAGSWTGYGIMLATAGLDLRGSGTFNGVVLVIGPGPTSIDGTVCLNGGIFIADTSGPGPNLGTPSWGIKGGGNCGTAYNSKFINFANQSGPWHVIAAREINQ